MLTLLASDTVETTAHQVWPAWPPLPVAQADAESC